MSKKILESLKSFFTQAQSELSTLRDKIAATNAEIESLANQPIDLRTAQGKLREGIADVGKRFQERHFRQVPLMNEKNLPNTVELNFKDATPFELACWLNPELVEAKMQGELKSFLEQYPGVDPTERAKKLAELRGSLRKLEQDEEQLIRGASEVGMTVPRRPDASPEIVLS